MQPKFYLKQLFKLVNLLLIIAYFRMAVYVLRSDPEDVEHFHSSDILGFHEDEDFRRAQRAHLGFDVDKPDQESKIKTGKSYVFNKKIPSSATNSKEIQNNLQTNILEITEIEKIPTNQNLDENSKFLLPILKSGPSEQLIGLYESMLLAKYTNRVLVVPNFYFYGTDNQHSIRKRSVVPELRLDYKSLLNSGVEIANLQDYKKFCPTTKKSEKDEDNQKIISTELIFQATNVFFQGVGQKTGRIQEFEKHTGVKVLDSSFENRRFYQNISVVPDFELDTLTINNFQYSMMGTEIKSKAPSLRKLSSGDVDEFIRQNWKSIYGSENLSSELVKKRCAIFLLPGKTIINPPKYLLKDFQSPELIKKGIFPFSKEINDMTDEFMTYLSNKETPNKRFLPKIILHWRYNNEDFNKKCSKQSLNERPSECKLVKNLSFHKLAQNLQNLIGDSTDESSKNSKIYLSAPQSSLKSLSNLFSQSTFTSKNILTSNDLKIFLEDKYQYHETYRYYAGETISLIEQCMSSKLPVFYYWPGSAWSERVTKLRDLKEDSRQNFESYSIFELLIASQKGGEVKQVNQIEILDNSSVRNVSHAGNADIHFRL